MIVPPQGKAERPRSMIDPRLDRYAPLVPVRQWAVLGTPKQPHVFLYHWEGLSVAEATYDGPTCLRSRRRSDEDSLFTVAHRHALETVMRLGIRNHLEAGNADRCASMAGPKVDRWCRYIYWIPAGIVRATAINLASVRYE